MVKSATGKNPCKRAEGDLGRNAEPEDQQDDGIERDLGDRIERGQDRLADLAGETVGAEREAGDQPADQRNQAGIDEGDAGRCDMPPKGRAGEILADAREGVARAATAPPVRPTVDSRPRPAATPAASST